MTTTAHALVGAAIASKFPDPILAPCLAIASHFVMDTVPHWDIGTHWRKRSKTETGLLAIAETLLGITVAYFLFREKAQTWLLLATIIASVLPDWLEAPWYIFFASRRTHGPAKRAGLFERITYEVYKQENRFHTKAEFPFGVLTQIATVIFFLLLLQ